MKGYIFSLIFIISISAGSVVADEAGKLEELIFQPLTLGEIHPTGWLENQLRIQAEGPTGRLDEVWPDIMDNSWIGGSRDGWERGPYWLDGLVPLAYLLNDNELKQKVDRWLDYILSHQQEDGWLGPVKKEEGKPRDPWPIYVLIKVMISYEQATNDERVIPACMRFLKLLDKQLDEYPLYDWNKFRWQELVWGIHWLYEQSSEEWLLQLADKIHRQGYDWNKHFDDLLFKEPAIKWELSSHVVNHAMAIKAPAVWYRQSHSADDAKMAVKAVYEMDRYHGFVTGVFSGDECVAGKMPSRGTELCAVVEYMFSLETMISILGEPAFADRLERIAYNALPGAFNDDMWRHQYIQMPNQVLCRFSKERIWTCTGECAAMWGLEPNFGCCTANLHQGWPKFVQYLWMKTRDNGLAAVCYGPCKIETKVKGVPVKVYVKTEYPFTDIVDIVIETNKPISFPLELRIPAWAQNATIELDNNKIAAKAGTFHKIDREWKDRSALRLHLPMRATIEKRFNDAVSIVRGPLVYSMKIEHMEKAYSEQYPGCWLYELYPSKQWNYGLVLDKGELNKSVKFRFRGVDKIPFSKENPPIMAKVKGRLLPEWLTEKNAAAAPVQSPLESNQPLTELTLVPYGCTELRITEFPFLK